MSINLKAGLITVAIALFVYLCAIETWYTLGITLGAGLLYFVFNVVKQVLTKDGIKL